MSTVCINGLNIHYEESGSGKPMLLLHGWGQNTEMMAFVQQGMEPHFHVYNLDFPGFGLSDEPKEPFGVEDYSEWLRAFCVALGIENPVIVGHSFGCRVAIHYAYRYPVRKMVLTGAAGLRDSRGLKYYARVYSYKAAKAIMSIGPLKKYKEDLANRNGSEDYRNSSGVMRATFVKVVNDDVKDMLPKINVETLLVFGSLDEATPLAKGQMMEKLMPNAALVTFDGDDHYAYFHQGARFNAVLDAFLRREYDR